MTASDSLRSQLLAELDFMCSRVPSPADWKYGSMWDLVRCEGETMTLSAEKPVERGLARRCFPNALSYAIAHELDYVEGYAMTPRIPMAIHHGWCARPGESEAIDPTWQIGVDEDAAYVGVRFSADWVLARSVTSKQVCVIDDPASRFEVVRLGISFEARPTADQPGALPR